MYFFVAIPKALLVPYTSYSFIADWKIKVIFDSLCAEGWKHFLKFYNLLTLLVCDIGMWIFWGFTFISKSLHRTRFPSSEPFPYCFWGCVKHPCCWFNSMLFSITNHLVSEILWVFTLPYHVVVSDWPDCFILVLISKDTKETMGLQILFRSKRYEAAGLMPNPHIYFSTHSLNPSISFLPNTLNSTRGYHVCSVSHGLDKKQLT